MAQKVKNLPAVQEIWVWFLGQEDSLEREMAVHSSILDWKIPWTNYMDPCSLVGYSPWGWIQLSNWTTTIQISSVQLLSRVRLCDPMDCSMPGLPVHHQLLELTQTHVHWVGDAMQRSHPLSSPFPPSFNLSQVVLLVKNPPADTGDLRDAGSVPGLGRSLGVGNATHSSILA